MFFLMTSVSERNADPSSIQFARPMKSESRSSALEAE